MKIYINLMDLQQNKLTKEEWSNIEIPINNNELTITKLIIDGFSTPNLSINNTLSLLSYIKITENKDIDGHLYKLYFQDFIKKLCKKYAIEFKVSNKSNVTIKTADKIRIENTEKTLMQTSEKLFEFIILKWASDMLKHKSSKKDNWHMYYYTIHQVMNINVRNKNSYVCEFITHILNLYKDDVDLYHTILNSSKYIEQNKNLLKFGNLELYSHQKQLFCACKTPKPKLILYTAPTGTGKTLSPLGLTEKYKVIFVCAARHVGLALARAAISCEKKIGFAFGCESVEDIRLHYFAAKDYVINKRTGSIGKVDNSVGDNVELLICDLKSYLHAMYYMNSFNEKSNIILYWDEPTISLDYSSHDLHQVIHENWNKNIIENVILSSATLPTKEELHHTICQFKEKFKTADIIEITSYDCKKTITVMDKNCRCVLPHLICNEYDELVECVNYCETAKTLLRYMDLNEIILFIKHAHNHKWYKHDRFSWKFHFETLDDVTLNKLKLYYLLLVKNIDKNKWNEISDFFQKNTKQIYNSNISVTTSDAYTLTDGPSIFLTNNVEKIAKSLLQSSKIPPIAFKNIYENIQYNTNISNKIQKLEEELQHFKCVDKDTMDKKPTSATPSKSHKQVSKSNTDAKDTMYEKANEITEKINALKLLIKQVTLHELFIPNSKAHIKQWAGNKNLNNPYTSNINSDTVEKIMLLNDIEDIWKLLLLMGIGVLSQHKSKAYTEIMKKLMNDQKLYLIIASGDFIYGTNYQFCHAYIGQDLRDITQEKIIQAIGRVGRGNIQQTYTIRLRHEDLVKRLFFPEKNKIEVQNMNKLLI